MPGCRPPCRTIPDGSATGMWACRPRVRWTRSRSALANRLVGNPEARGGARDRGDRPIAALRLRHRDRRHGRRFRCAARWCSRAALGGRSGCGRRGARRWLRRKAAGAARILRSPAASTCPTIWAAAALSSSEGSAATQGGPCARETCCTSATRSGDPCSISDAIRNTRTSGKSACSTVRMAHPISSRDEDIEMFFSTAWKVHYNSDRTGVRLIGPKPTWARNDGGEAGLHPSNIHDNAYAVGTVDFTGDMPVILGPDGPSLGGFVCPATIVHAELWKIGQLRPGDSVRFRALAHEQAIEMNGSLPPAPAALVDPVLHSAPGLVIRADGDRYLLVEYGPNVLDLNLRFRVHALEDQLRSLGLRGIIDITPGVRSLHIHYDTGRLSREALLEALDACERRIPDLDDIWSPRRASCTCRSPGTTRPRSSRSASTCSRCGPTRRGVRATSNSSAASTAWTPSTMSARSSSTPTTWCSGWATSISARRSPRRSIRGIGWSRPSTIRRAPGRRKTQSASAARTCASTAWKVPADISSSGARCRCGIPSARSPPWLLRFFDQIRFYPVSAEELLEMREAFPHGGYPLKIEEREFRLRDYHAFLESIERETAEVEGAGNKPRSRPSANAGHWPVSIASWPRMIPVPAGHCSRMRCPKAAARSARRSRPVCGTSPSRPDSAWRRARSFMVLEAMKMEIAVAAPSAGVIEMVNCIPGALVTAGQRLVTLRREI